MAEMMFGSFRSWDESGKLDHKGRGIEAIHGNVGVSLSPRIKSEQLSEGVAWSWKMVNILLGAILKSLCGRVYKLHEIIHELKDTPPDRAHQYRGVSCWKTSKARPLVIYSDILSSSSFLDFKPRLLRAAHILIYRLDDTPIFPSMAPDTPSVVWETVFL